MKKWEQHLAKHIMLGKEAIAKGKEPRRESVLALKGLKTVDFVWSAEKFQDFVDIFCNEDKKPNEAVWELITEAMEKESGK